MKTKRKLHKYIRLMLIILSIVIFAVASVMVYRELKIPKFAEEKVSLYSSNHKSDVKYQVFLKPNILYDKEKIEEGQLYLTEFVDHIQTSFTYHFTGEADAEVIGDYAIIAAVEGYTIEEEKVKTIWKKEFKLVPKTEFKTKDKNIKIEKEVSLSLEQYNTFVEQIAEASKINALTKLSVFMNVDNKTITKKGELVEKFTPQLVIPLGANSFEITKSGVEEKPGVIEETKKVQLPPDKKMINIYAGIIGSALILLCCLIGFTSSAKVDPLEKKLKSIFKKHGNRLVALNAETAVTSEAHREVKSIDDLVRIADELGKPILYQYSEEPKDITQFTVHDEICIYAYHIEDIPEDQTKSKPKIKKIKLKTDQTKEDEIMS